MAEARTKEEQQRVLDLRRSSAASRHRSKKHPTRAQVKNSLRKES